MKSMFFDCKKLTNINLSSFETENVKIMTSMFNGCENLNNINFKNFLCLINLENII